MSGEDPRNLVKRTWHLTLDSFEARGLPEAVTLLRLLARFASDPLPLSLLNRPEINSVLPRTRTERALRALLDQSLTELVDVGVRCAQTHGVLLDSAAAATPSETLSPRTRHDSGPTARRRGSLALPRCRPVRATATVAGPACADPLLRRVSEPPSPRRTCWRLPRLVLIAALHRTGDYLSAQETAHTAARLAEPALGAEHRLVLAVRSRAGRALFRLGRYSEAELLLRRVPRRSGAVVRTRATRTPWTPFTVSNSWSETSVDGARRPLRSSAPR